MQPARTEAGDGNLFNVSSGYRSKALNAAIPGSSATSYHCFGLATDIWSNQMTNEEIIRLIVEMNLPYDKLINEYPESDTGGWMHAQSAKHGAVPRRELRITKVASNGKVSYPLWKLPKKRKVYT